MSYFEYNKKQLERNKIKEKYIKKNIRKAVSMKRCFLENLKKKKKEGPNNTSYAKKNKFNEW